MLNRQSDQIIPELQPVIRSANNCTHSPFFLQILVKDGKRTCHISTDIPGLFYLYWIKGIVLFNNHVYFGIRFLSGCFFPVLPSVIEHETGIVLSGIDTYPPPTLTNSDFNSIFAKKRDDCQVRKSHEKMVSGNTTPSRGSPPCTIMCGLASNDYAPGRIFGCSLGASCNSISFPRKGDLC